MTCSGRRSRNGTPLGRAVVAYVDRGELAPDELVMQLVVPRALAASARGGYVLDGFPRSVPQAVEARKLAEPARARPDLVVYLDVPDEVLVRRLVARGQAYERRDDTGDVIRHRFAVFAEATAPLLAYYRDEGLAASIDATGSPDRIAKDILALAVASAP